MDQLLYQFLFFTGIAFWAVLLIWLFLRWRQGKKWPLLVGGVLFLGPALVGSTKKLTQEIRERKIEDATLAQVAVGIFSRLTYISIIGLVLALVPIWLLSNQNELLQSQNEKIDIQNERINLQNNLIEADRRGSLVILMSNIMDQMNAEINKQKEKDQAHFDSIGYRLSDPLIGRIAALSQGFLPYRYLEGDTLTEKAVSLERGQLWLALVKSNLDSITYDKIYQAAVFSSAYLDGASIRGVSLRGADLREADLLLASLNGADLSEADLSKAGLTFADLSEADLSGTDLSVADLIGTGLRGTDLSEADLSEASFIGASLHEAKNLTADQLKTARSLYLCRGLDPTLHQQLQKEKTCLFTEEGCPENKK